MTTPEPSQAPSADDEGLSSYAVDYEGAGLINTSFAGTGLLLVAGAVGAASPERWGGMTAVLSGVLFGVGVIGFLYGYAIGVVRSAGEKVTMGGLFFLSGTAPRVVRFRMRVALIVQIVIAVAVAAARPYTSVAFAVLAPMLGLGLMAAWAAKYGTFFLKGQDEVTPEVDDGDAA